MTLSIIIVNYNVKSYLEQCLRSVWKAVEGIEAEVFVVDNHSTDDSIPYLKSLFPPEAYPGLHFICNSRNMGFGRANNQAVRMATGRYLLFLNPDTVLTAHTLTDCLAFADAHPDMGALGVRMLKADGSFAYESRRGFPSPWTAFCKMCGLCHLFPKSRLFGRYYMRYLDDNVPNEIEVVSGAFMMIPREKIQGGKAFDEDFFMYGEDIDLSYRLLKNGNTNYYLPTPILHYKGESTLKSSFRYVHVFYQAMLIFFNKHYQHYRFWLSIPIRTAIYTRAFVALIQQSAEKARDMLTIGKKEPDIKILFMGKAEHITRARQLNEQWMFDMDYIQADRQSAPQGHLQMPTTQKSYQYVIYDTAAYNYDDVFRIFAQNNRADLKMGFFLPESDLLITESMTYSA